MQKQKLTQNKEHTQTQLSDRQLEQDKRITHQNQQIIVQQNNNCNKEREGTNNAIPTVMTERSGDKRLPETDTGGTALSRRARFMDPHGNSAGGAQLSSRKEDDKSAGDSL